MSNLSQEELNILSGESARLWRFFSSHDRLVFLLTGLVEEKDRYLVFLGCEKMHISTIWKIRNPKIARGESASYQLTDGDINIQFEESRIMDDYSLA